jgi:ubiquinone/menaquinone biosynthesis C-methylase UbiE
MLHKSDKERMAKWELAQASYNAKTFSDESLLTKVLPQKNFISTLFKQFSFVGDNKTVLDIACGNGVVGGKNEYIENVFYLDKRQKLYGCDLLINHNFFGDFVCCNVENMSFQDEVFDAVTCCSALDHFVCPEKVFSEAARILKKGGKFFISQAIQSAESKKVDAAHAHHIYVYSIESIKDLYKIYGFTAFEVAYSMGTLPVFFMEGVRSAA